MKIRAATEADADGIAACFEDLGVGVSPALVRTRIEAAGRDWLSIMLTADDGAGSVAGVVALQVIPMLQSQHNVARVTALAVRGDRRRGGIGKALMESAEALAWSRGCARIEVVEGFRRADAQAFYASLGYQLVANRLVKTR